MKIFKFPYNNFSTRINNNLYEFLGTRGIEILHTTNFGQGTTIRGLQLLLFYI